MVRRASLLALATTWGVAVLVVARPGLDQQVRTAQNLCSLLFSTVHVLALQHTCRLMPRGATGDEGVARHPGRVAAACSL